MSGEVARIYVGTDERMGKAERVLEHSLRRHASIEVEIHWMRAGDPGFEGWEIGRKPGAPYSGGSWSTDFTCFRFAVPEVAGFQGRAIYLDADMLVLADVRELWDRRRRRPWTCPGGRSEVSVIDCAAFREAGVVAAPRSDEARWPPPRRLLGAARQARAGRQLAVRAMGRARSVDARRQADPLHGHGDAALEAVAGGLPLPCDTYSCSISTNSGNAHAESLACEDWYAPSTDELGSLPAFPIGAEPAASLQLSQPSSEAGLFGIEVSVIGGLPRSVLLAARNPPRSQHRTSTGP